jgi:hypothetical protein
MDDDEGLAQQVDVQKIAAGGDLGDVRDALPLLAQDVVDFPMEEFLARVRLRAGSCWPASAGDRRCR